MTNTLVINADGATQRIDPNIYGQFAEHLGRCIYEGFWVGEDSDIPNTRGIRNDVIEALRKLQVPVLRWPGGCFADEYHWRDGIGPRENRPCMINTHWGGVVENNHFGTHEFFDLCEMLGAEPYICGNVGSGSVQEMQEWVEYCTFDGSSPLANLCRENGRDEPWKLPYFGVGNESWGCGGHMRPEHYADEYRRYQTYVRNLGGNKVYKIACGANSADYNWTDVVMRQAGNHMDGLSLHYYTVLGTWQSKGSATEFNEADWFKTLKLSLYMDELLHRHGTIMDKYDAAKRVAIIVDEWGTWWDVEPGTNPGFLYQQNTLRDAFVAALSLNIFHQHASRVRMTNIAQTVNVLQAMILTDGAQMLLTPTYHVFEMYKVHQGALALQQHLTSDNYEHNEAAIPAINASSSRDEQGAIHISLCHLDPNRTRELTIDLRGAELINVSGRLLTADRMQALNTFDAPNSIEPQNFDGATVRDGKLQITLPAQSIVQLRVGA